MAPRILITGATGYIGGDILYALHEKHPDCQYTALVRTQANADLLLRCYPGLEVIIGSLDDARVLEQAAADADVVIHTAESADHPGAAQAIAKGLARGHSDAHPGYWLHTGGTGSLTYDDMTRGKLGEWSDKQYNDWSGVHELTHLPEKAMHRNVDKIVLDAGTERAARIKTAIVCPPTVYGTGRGLVNQRSRQVYDLAKFVMEKRWVPIIGEGQARWNNLHVHDLSDAFVLLTEAAVAGNVDPELWGEKGYLAVENGEHAWGDIARRIGAAAAELGHLERGYETKTLDAEDAINAGGFATMAWAWNARARSIRLNKVLHWKPSRSSLEEEIPEIVQGEYERLASSRGKESMRNAP
ncbi:hypothetical protein LTR53_015137 [Teratosphaeriaceae sp. CCFEE 6253]|nr:hypothetical protein LTR53_015137 [Teratosphaeriaceae sp. CCFEE 6253]